MAGSVGGSHDALPTSALVSPGNISAIGGAPGMSGEGLRGTDTQHLELAGLRRSIMESEELVERDRYDSPLGDGDHSGLWPR